EGRLRRPVGAGSSGRGRGWPTLSGRPGVVWAAGVVGWGAAGLFAGGAAEREADAQGRLAGARIDGDRAAVPFHYDPLRDVQAQAGALANVLSGEERLERARGD